LPTPLAIAVVDEEVAEIDLPTVLLRAALEVDIADLAKATDRESAIEDVDDAL
jgi:hypothetical protein